MFGLFKKKPEPGVRPPTAMLLKLMSSTDGWKKDTEKEYTRLHFGSNIWVYPNGQALWWGTPSVTVFFGNRRCIILPLNKAERRTVRMAGYALEKRLQSNTVIEWEDDLSKAEQIIEDALSNSNAGG